MNTGRKLIFSSLVCMIGGYFAMIAAGLGGIIFTPVVYIIGPILMILGIAHQIEDYRNPQSRKDLIIIGVVATILAIIFTIGIVISHNKDVRDEYCTAHHPLTGGSDYDTSDYVKCLQHKID